MGKYAVLGVVTMVVSFSMYEGYINCHNNVDVNREGIFGKNVTLGCHTSWICKEIRWDKLLEDNTVDLLLEEQVLVGHSTSYLSINEIGFHQDVLYRCWCYVGEGATKICSIILKTICQATVDLNGRTTFYNSSLPNSYSVDVTAEETISITCFEGATLERNCPIDLLPAPDELTLTFNVLPVHNSCLIECQWRKEDGTSCRVGFTLNVTRLETSTLHSTTDQSPSNIIPNDRPMPGSFPVMPLIGFSIVVFLGILFIIGFFNYSSRSKPTSRPKKTQTSSNESPDTNIAIDSTYVIVNRFSSGCTKDDSELGILCNDDAYAEVNRAGKEESSTQHTNAVKAETSITKDYYSVVSTSNTKLESTNSENKSDSALYIEVKQGE